MTRALAVTALTLTAATITLAAIIRARENALARVAGGDDVVCHCWACDHIRHSALTACQDCTGPCRACRRSA